MAIDTLRPRGPKKNHKKGIAAAKREQKRREGEQRMLEYSKLTNGQRLAKLDAGGHAAKKQRARIMKSISEGKV